MYKIRTTASGYLALKTGTEGPQHDPYSYQEWEIKRGEQIATLHIGLGVWLSLNKGPIRQGGRDDEDAQLVAKWEALAGISLWKAQKALHRRPRMSRKEARELAMMEAADDALLRYSN